MFGKFRKQTTSIYDEAINKLLTELQEYDPNVEEYKSAMDQLERLTKLKADNAPRRVSPDTMAVVAANLIGILIIVAYEHGHVVGSKATGFVMKPK